MRSEERGARGEGKIKSIQSKIKNPKSNKPETAGAKKLNILPRFTSMPTMTPIMVRLGWYKLYNCVTLAKPLGFLFGGVKGGKCRLIHRFR